MKTKIFFTFAFLVAVQFASAQKLFYLNFEPVITPDTKQVELNFSYSGVSADDRFEWQLTAANPDGKPNWSKTIAYMNNIEPRVTGDGVQTITINVVNDPEIGEEYTWAGKVTLDGNGKDVGYNSDGNVVKIAKVVPAKK